MTTPSTASWTDPTTNTDGSAIAAGEITGYTVGARSATASGSAAGTYPYSVTAPATATSVLLSALTPVLPPGSYMGAVRANTANNSSAWSAEVAFTIPEVPSAPTGFSIA